MTEVAPSGLGGRALQLLTGQSVEFVKADADEASGKKEREDDEDNAGSPVKRPRATTATPRRNGAIGEKPSPERRAPTTAEPASCDGDDGDDVDTAPWFKSLTRSERVVSGKGDEDEGDDDKSEEVAQRRRHRAAYLDSLATPTSISPPPAGSEFTTNWFTHNQPALLRVFESLGWAGTVGSQPRHVIEVGCWEGRSSQWLLTTLCRRRGSTLTCVDTWRGGVQYHDIGLDLDGESHSADAVERRFDANVELVIGVHPESDAPENPVRKIKGRSAEVLATLMAENEGGGKFDVAYVDGSHMARDVMHDGILCWELLRRGGVLVFDDYAWDQIMEHLPPEKCPRMAIDAFLAMFKDELLVLEKGYQCVVQKIVMPK